MVSGRAGGTTAELGGKESKYHIFILPTRAGGSQGLAGWVKAATTGSSREAGASPVLAERLL